LFHLNSSLLCLLFDKAVLAESTHPCIRLDKFCATWALLFALCGGVGVYHKCDDNSDQRTHEKRQEEDSDPAAAFAPCDVGGYAA
jgi:hypothetical protein